MQTESLTFRLWSARSAGVLKITETSCDLKEIISAGVEVKDMIMIIIT